MSLFVSFEKAASLHDVMGLHVYEPNSVAEHSRHVDTIQADGDELMRILTSFGDTIPNSKRLVQRWYGDTAKSIAYSWKADGS